MLELTPIVLPPEFRFLSAGGIGPTAKIFLPMLSALTDPPCPFTAVPFLRAASSRFQDRHRLVQIGIAHCHEVIKMSPAAN
jgi:hypothetical protein